MSTAHLSDLESALRSHPALDVREPGQTWTRHPQRHRWRSYRTELGVALRSIGRRPARHRVLIFCCPRTGSTLLTDIIGQLPGVTSRKELLVQGKLFPRAYLRNAAALSPTPIFSCKLLSYQLLFCQPIRSPVAFFARLQDEGVRFIHLTRSPRRGIAYGGDGLNSASCG